MRIENEVLYNIWKDRYRKGNETIDDNLRRVAKYIALNKEEENDFYNVMNNGFFFPAGRTMSNSGIGSALTLGNCFTLNFVEDNIVDIFDKVKMGAITQKAGGGTGYEFSKIRPNGTPTSNDAIASGVVSFMDVFNAQTSCILQGGRRGANMSVLSVRHPDIFDYINAKSYEEGKLVHFNMSVMVDDEFMLAVENDADFNLHYPVYDDKGFIIKDESKWQIKKTVRAKELWNIIMKKAYDNGEPGVLFYENINRDNNTYYIETIINTNPCLRGDMRILTSDGYKYIKELDGKEVELINKDGQVSLGKVWCSGEKEIYKISTKDKDIYCTKDHRFMLINGEECEAQNLKGKKIMPYLNKNIKTSKEFELYGFMQGDGTLGRLKSDTHLGIEVNIGQNDKDISDYFNLDVKDRTSYLVGYKDKLISLGFSSNQLPMRTLPTTFNNWDKLQKISFMRGLYSANGSVLSCGRITFKTTCKQLSEEIHNVLKEFDIDSYITRNREHDTKFKNGTYTCKESYDINICKYGEKLKFYNTIGFIHNYKNIKLSQNLIEKSPTVQNVKSTGQIEKVYDFNEPLTHWGVVEGLITHNCGEYLSGLLYGNDLDSSQYKGACNLGSIFVQNLVLHPFTNEACIDLQELQNTIRVAVRILDNIIDINKFPHEHYENYQKSLRTIGLGISGLADAMCMLGITYGSKESIEFTDNLMNFITSEAYYSSTLLSKEKGTFPYLDKEKFIQSGFIQKHLKKGDKIWKDVVENIDKYGIRNARLISVAPTGTLSLTFGNNCSSGLEPIFSLEYDRKVKMGGQSDDNVRIVKMQDYAYKLWQETNNKTVAKDVFVTAMNLPVSSHIDILSTVAYHTDMSCSKTINVPTDYPFEDCKNIYMRAWKEGIKGCTIFRPNEIRQGILISPESKEESNPESNLNRGDWKPLADDTIYIKKPLNIGCGKLKLFIGYSPSENSIQDLYIKKAGNGGCTHNIEAVAVALSAVYRLGGSTKNIEKAFSGLGGCNSFLQSRIKGEKLSKGSSCATSILNILKQMESEFNLKPVTTEIVKNIESNTKDNHEIFTEEEKLYLKDNGETSFASRYKKCPLCGEKLEFTSGCLTCQSCGFSKC